MRYLVFVIEDEHIPVLLIDVARKSALRSAVQQYYQEQRWSGQPEQLLIVPMPENEKQITHLITLHSPFQ